MGLVRLNEHMKLKQTELTEMCQRATPEQWTKFITASRVIKILRDEQPNGLVMRLRQNCFEENRKPAIGLFFVRSRIKKGQQASENRLLFMCAITYPWNKDKGN
jgi:hypothetical protein